MLWYEENRKADDVFVSTRVRLARNLVDYPFEPILCEAGAKEIIEKVRGALGRDARELEITPALAERRVISRELVKKNTPKAVFASDGGVYTMVCEEDHLRIQCIRSGFNLSGALEGALKCEEKIDSRLKIAYDEKLGYLTHCPTNLGTAMRASVMMFLPALTAFGTVKSLAAQLSKVGITVRGEGGEGSDVRGCLYQISNSVSLGEGEEEIIEKLEKYVSAIAEREREAREKLMAREGDKLHDRIMRALGTARYAHLINTAELYRLYTDLRLGCALGICELDAASLDRALIMLSPNTLCESAGRQLTEGERDKVRAEKLKKYVN